jgi:hypothetical protein
MTPPKVRPLGQPETRFADGKYVTKPHTFWVAGHGGGRTYKVVGILLLVMSQNLHRKTAVA